MKHLEIVEKLVGEIKPVGSTHIDSQRFENLKTMCDLINQLVTKIDEVTSYDQRVEYSMREMGEYASNFILKELGIKSVPLKQLNKELTEALEKAQHDINWMLNNRQFLNQDCFNYLEAILAKAKYEIRRFEM